MNHKQLPTVGILIFDDAQVLDFCGPFEVFSVARPVRATSDESKLFTVITIAEEDKVITCRGGLLDHHRATTYWRSIEWLHNTYPGIEAIADERVVDEGHIITSAGVSAGIDMSLHVVSRLYGADVAAWTARQMEYDWSAHLRAFKTGLLDYIY